MAPSSSDRRFAQAQYSSSLFWTAAWWDAASQGGGGAGHRAREGRAFQVELDRLAVHGGEVKVPISATGPVFDAGKSTGLRRAPGRTSQRAPTRSRQADHPP